MNGTTTHPRRLRLPPLPWALIWLAATAAILSGWILVGAYDHHLMDLLESFCGPKIRYTAVYEFLGLFRVWGKANTVILLMVFIGAMGYRRLFLRMLLALALTAIMVWALKLSVGRMRPNEKNSFSFPSGDAATAAVLGAVLATASPKLLPVGVGVTLAVAAIRVYDDTHHPSDVLAGIAFGLLAMGMASWLMPRAWDPLRRLLPKPRWWVPIALAWTAIGAAVDFAGAGEESIFLQFYFPLLALPLVWRYLPFLARTGNGAIVRKIRTAAAWLAACTMHEYRHRSACRAVLVMVAVGGAIITGTAWMTPGLIGLRVSITGICLGSSCFCLAALSLIHRQQRMPAFMLVLCGGIFASGFLALGLTSGIIRNQARLIRVKAIQDDLAPPPRRQHPRPGDPVKIILPGHGSRLPNKAR